MHFVTVLHVGCFILVQCLFSTVSKGHTSSRLYIQPCYTLLRVQWSLCQVLQTPSMAKVTLCICPCRVILARACLDCPLHRSTIPFQYSIPPFHSTESRHPSLYVKLHLLNSRIFYRECFIRTKPELNIVSGWLWQMLTKPRRIVELTAGAGTTTACSIP